jgi:hypothetical protein
LKEWKNDYSAETLSIYNEIVFRYHKLGRGLPDVQLSKASFSTFRWMDEGTVKNVLSGELIGPHPLDKVADYVEMLARGLPI